MLSILSAPTDLGLRPPEPGATPGTSKAPEALREAGLHDRLVRRGAHEAGVVLPGRYVESADRGPREVRNQAAIIDHARRVAARIADLIGRGTTPLVLGGDCSLLLGAGLALRRSGEFGLVHVDGHTDFRHPGNSTECASLAGEDLAAAIGLHWPAVGDIDALGPYFAPQRTAHLGCRADDEHLTEVRGLLGAVVTASGLSGAALPHAAEQARRTALSGGADGYWLHLDVDVLDPVHMPAVDSPDPGGIDPDGLVRLLRALAPQAVGIQVTVFDPDLDPDGRYARLLADILDDGLAGYTDPARAAPGARPGA
ncbi:arginase [Murinocardiopsis flavida]|uniref:Arginase n=1 Tax=Murinocardiopsis flavida TaxID=645275 RepID=A0A2P8CSZ1_9ACTN|nr:arginase family protein [Murinocardiopsis flavida]PSK88084.1 arginase [Murinocardiopsis flavida]